MTITINVKKLNLDTAKLLKSFFAESGKAEFWSKGKTYSLKNGQEISFTHDLYKRKRKQRFNEHGIPATDGFRYEVISNQDMLGKGNYGKVFKIKGTLALDEKSYRFKKPGKDKDSRVVKIQEHDFQNNTLENLKNEIFLTDLAGHMAIKPPAVNSGELYPVSYTTMKELQGKKLDLIIKEDYLKINVLTAKQRADICIALLNALKEQVSSKDIIHRDIKPENIFVDLKDPVTASIFDYGLGILTSEPDDEMKGTPLFMSPEIIGGANPLNLKADVFSLARVMALLWRVDRSEIYNENRKIPNLEHWKFYYLLWTPEKKLEGLFQDINDLDPAKGETIRRTLLGMLQSNPDERLSLEEAIKLFPSIELDKPPLEIKKDSPVENQQKNSNSSLNSYSLFSSKKNTVVEMEIPSSDDNSWLTDQQHLEILALICELQREVNSYWPYPNKDRKEEKIKGLNLLIGLSYEKPTLGLEAAIKEIESGPCPEFRTGKISQRVATLMSEFGAPPLAPK